MRERQSAALTTITLLVGASAWAQNPQPATPVPSVGTATVGHTGIPPSQRNALLTDGGNVRVGKMIGTAIYNKDDQKLGSVDDVTVSPNGQL